MKNTKFLGLVPPLPKFLRWVLRFLLIVAGILTLVVCGILFYFSRFPDIQPQDVSDLIPERVEVPEEENAYPVWREAFDMVVESETPGLLSSYYDGDAGAREEVLQLLQKNQPAFLKFREGAKRPGFAFEIEYRSDFIIQGISESLEFAKWMRVQIREYRLQGELDKAVDLAVDLNDLGTRSCEGSAVLLHYLVGTAIYAMSVEENQALLQETEITRQQLRRLQDSLPDAAVFREGAKQAFKGEFMWMKNRLEQSAKGGVNLDQFFWFGAPWEKKAFQLALGNTYFFQVHRSTFVMAEEVRRNIHFLEDPALLPQSLGLGVVDYWQTSGWVKQLKQPNFLGMMFLSNLLGPLESVVEKSRRMTAAADALSILIALRRYELDHEGLPADLSELVPEYLQAVPPDPFDGQPFRYDRERAWVYSVGKDRVDHGGSVVHANGRRREVINAEDQVYSLRESWEEIAGSEDEQ